MSKSNYELLLAKLDKFTRKFYLSQVLKGTLITVGIVLAYFLVITLLENQFYFGSSIRQVFFFSFLALLVGTIFFLVIKPLSAYLSLGKRMSNEKAALIIGSHFSGVQDKLLNILQLKENNSLTTSNLISASIDQKTEEIKLVPFSNAIDLGKNKRYLKYATPPFLVLLALLFANPGMIQDSSTRIIQNQKEFEREAPFHFQIANDNLQVVQFENYHLTVKTTGDVLPNEAFILIDGFRYRMKQSSQGEFNYTFNNVQKDLKFSVESGFVKSDEKKLSVLYKPVINTYRLIVDAPNYTGIRTRVLENDGDLVVPIGTRVNWEVQANHVDDIEIQFNKNTRQELEQKSDKDYVFNKRILKNGGYKIFLSNDQIISEDSISHVINVIPDNYPNISSEQFIDSTNKKIIFLVGQASDDYGISKLGFHYQVIRPDGTNGELISTPIAPTAKQNAKFQYTLDINAIELQAGEQLNYYFEVHDNDAVNGSKSNRTQIYQFSLPSLKELEDQIDKNDEQVQSNLDQNKQESKKLKEDVKKLKEEILQEKSLEWEKKKDLEKLIEKQKQLQNKVEEAQQKFEENLKNQEQLEQPSEELQKKQEKLQELFDKAQNEELQNLMEKIEELMDELEKDEALEMLDDFQQMSEEMEFEMERLLEMYKQLEVELELEKEINELKELAEEQKKVGEENQDKKDGESNQEEQKKQEEIKEKFEEIKEKLDDIEKKNEELSKPKDISDQGEKEDQIQKKQDQSMEDMKSGENQKAGEKQKEAGEEMQEMAESLEQTLQEGEEEQAQEDMEMLRQILENLITLSYDQEELIALFKRSRTNTPHYRGLTQGQKKIQDDFQIVEDSLRELSTRVFELESFITEKVSEIKTHLRKGLDDLEERNKSQAGDHQQRTMKNLNDLALMLNESLEQMQQQMAQSKPNAQCNKPGNNPGKPGNVPMDKLTKSQGKANEKMKEAMQNQKKGGEKSSKEFAELAAEQAAIRKAMEEKRNAQGEKGQRNKELGKLIEEMDKIETDLVNKKLTNEMISRQQDILTRMLEEERAEKEREYDNKRKSAKGDEFEKTFPPALEEYLKQRESEIDTYKRISPELRAYYKGLVEKYYKELNN